MVHSAAIGQASGPVPQPLCRGSGCSGLDLNLDGPADQMHDFGFLQQELTREVAKAPEHCLLTGDARYLATSFQKSRGVVLGRDGGGGGAGGAFTLKAITQVLFQVYISWGHILLAHLL